MTTITKKELIDRISEGTNSKRVVVKSISVGREYKAR